jgi:hypothetical protein
MIPTPRRFDYNPAGTSRLTLYADGIHGYPLLRERRIQILRTMISQANRLGMYEIADELSLLLGRHIAA